MLENNFRLIREKHDLSIRDVAKILNISKSHYSRFEKDNKFSIENLVNFCTYFHVSSDYALGLSNNKHLSKDNYYFDSSIFAQRLREERKRSKITQTKLAEKLNINQSMISSYERNKTKMQGLFLFSLSKELNVSSDYLIGLSNVRNTLPN